MPTTGPGLAQPASGAILPSNEAGLTRLARLLAVKRGFQFFVLACPDPQERDRLIARLGATPDLAGRPVLRVDLSEHGPSAAAPADVAALETQLHAEAADDAIVHLVNGDGWLKPDRIADLNLHRNALAARVPAALLWWLPAVTVTKLARGAPDVWSWRSAVVAFEGAGAPDALAEPAGMPSPLARIGRSVDGLSLAEKEARLAELERELPQLRSLELRRDLLLESADILVALGRLDEALTVLRTQFMPAVADDPFQTAVARSRIAAILITKGELDEALEILSQKVLPALEELGDVRSKAVIQQKIAEILVVRGRLEDALRLLSDEVLPVLAEQGDLRSHTATRGAIADILMARGELDKALHIMRGEELPIYQQLGDVWATAVCQGKIALILAARGELDEALRIRTEEQLPVFERLGDVREMAITRGWIASILAARGELDEALRIRTKEELPVLERLGDVRQMLMTRANIGILLLKRNAPGDHVEARRLLDLALADARRLQLPRETAAIESWLKPLDGPA